MASRVAMVFLLLTVSSLTSDSEAVATRCNDPQLTNFVESEFLQEQVDSMKKISEYVSQLRRVGKGHGVWHFDRMLLEEAA